MKKIVLGAVAAAAVAGGAALVPSGAGATGGGGSAADSVTVGYYADYNLSGLSLDLDLVVKCAPGAAGGTGTVTGSVTQEPPETPAPVTLSTGTSLVVCDGKPHTVGLTVDGAGFDDGKAKATVTLTNPSLKATTVTAPIYITAH